VAVVSDQFEGKRLLDRHRMVHLLQALTAWICLHRMSQTEAFIESQVRVLALKIAVECADQQCPRGGDEGDTCTQHKAMLDTRAAEGKATILRATIEALTCQVACKSSTAVYRETSVSPGQTVMPQEYRELVCSMASCGLVSKHGGKPVLKVLG